MKPKPCPGVQIHEGIDVPALARLEGARFDVKTNRHQSLDGSPWGWIDAAYIVRDGTRSWWGRTEVAVWSGRDGERAAAEAIAAWNKREEKP